MRNMASVAPHNPLHIGRVTVAHQPHQRLSVTGISRREGERPRVCADAEGKQGGLRLGDDRAMLLHDRVEGGSQKAWGEGRGGTSEEGRGGENAEVGRWEMGIEKATGESSRSL